MTSARQQLDAERRRLDEHLMARERVFSLGLLAGSVVHDLNNPIAGIMGHAQLLIESETDPEKLTLLREVMKEAERCRLIVSDLLASVRRQPGEKGTVDMGAVLGGALALRERSLRAAGIRADLSVDADLPRVHGVEHQLQQAVLNIVINAEQALAESGESIVLMARRSADEGHKGDAIELTIHNDGPAIRPADVDHIFDPFFTTKVAEEGTGLGLAISRRIIEEHGGELAVESGATGTTFRMILPISEPGY
jgi:signal transduction histidine kinase